MDLEVVTPEEYLGEVLAMSPPGAAGSSASSAHGARVVRGHVPLAEVFGYATDLRSRTQGRATFTLQFHSYQEVPESVQRGLT